MKPFNIRIINTLNTKLTRAVFFSLAVFTSINFISCKDEDPKKENAPEMITTLSLTFVPTAGTGAAGPSVTVTATDPDGEGVQNLTADGPINLLANETYELEMQMINELAPVNSEAYLITDEIRNEGAEHLIFFGWTNNLFSDPAGNGNIDSRTDDVNYADEDDNGLPIGLHTSWTTGTATASGTFRILLKHQPGQKSATSPSTTGETDLDITFNVNIQ